MPSAIRKKLDNKMFNSNYSDSKLNAGDKFTQSNMLIPPNMLGISSNENMFHSASHRNQHISQFSKLLNNGTDSSLSVSFFGEDGKKAITEPFQIGGQMRYPDSEGKIRFVNKGNIEQVQAIKRYNEEMLQKVLDVCLLGDDVASYVLGLTPDEWARCCKAGGKPYNDTRIWSDELLNIDCRIEVLESLVAGSQLQMAGISKLRKVVQFYLKNVNIEGFDTLSEKLSQSRIGVDNTAEEAKEAKGELPKPS